MDQAVKNLLFGHYKILQIKIWKYIIKDVEDIFDFGEKHNLIYEFANFGK